MMDRREMLQRLGLGFAAAGLAACTRAPDQEIVPYVQQPREVTPGVARFYATSMIEGGYATGLLVESHEGRPTKIEGNPRHPASLGATSAIHQAWVQELYDPGRAQAIARSGRLVSRRSFEGEARVRPGTHLLLSPTSSPAVAARIARLREVQPDVRVWFDPDTAPMNAWEGARRAFGKVLEVEADLSRAEVVVSIDGDPLARGPRALRDARAFGDARRRERLRLWAVEASLSCTGIAADARIRMRSSDVAAFVASLLADVAAAKGVTEWAGFSRAPNDRRAQLVRDLLQRPSVLLVGDEQPPEVHVLVHALHQLLGSAVTYRPSPILEAGEASFSRRPLLDALNANAVELLCISGEDPVFTAPAGEDWRAIDKAKLSIVHALRANASSKHAHHLVPQKHGLESWGDARSFDGTLGIVQPLIAPLFESLSLTELLATLAGDLHPDDRGAIRELHRFEEGGFERALQAGFLDGTAFAPITTTLDRAAVSTALAAIAPAKEGLEIRFPLDAKLHDGRYAELPWLLELPDPITKNTWRNAARISPKTAKRLGLATGDEIEIALDDRKLRVHALVSPGDADDVITLPRGWPDANANALRTRDFQLGAAVQRTGEKTVLAITQTETRQEGRPIALSVTRAKKDEDLKEIAEHRKPRETLYKLPLVGSPMGNHWGMVVDLSTCIGCSACVVACQAENNIPTVGEAGVRAQREMHWLRIDRYDDGSEDDPRVVAQPMLCQHCEKAPCEYVCPVNATVHSPDGLNEQLYHRCVGTRFCSNNCPYKVRRFNWFKYQTGQDRLQHNPDVTVRGRGGMEKCTFCVQRLRRAEIDARVDHRPFHDGDAKTACQQSCPTGAIVFGSIGDPKSAVSEARKSPRMYAVLDELGTDPRVRYLAKVVDEPEGEK
jgi:molybdopterin-containing oxidoreductase family iron-sulfur binding subunit